MTRQVAQHARALPCDHEADEQSQATWLRVSATYSGSVSQITRLRPLRLAA